MTSHPLPLLVLNLSSVLLSWPGVPEDHDTKGVAAAVDANLQHTPALDAACSTTKPRDTKATKVPRRKKEDVDGGTKLLPQWLPTFVACPQWMPRVATTTSKATLSDWKKAGEPREPVAKPVCPEDLSFNDMQ